MLLSIELAFWYHAHFSGLTILLLKKKKRNGLLNVGEHCQEEEESGALCTYHPSSVFLLQPLKNILETSSSDK